MFLLSATKLAGVFCAKHEFWRKSLSWERARGDNIHWSSLMKSAYFPILHMDCQENPCNVSRDMRGNVHLSSRKFPSIQFPKILMQWLQFFCPRSEIVNSSWTCRPGNMYWAPQQMATDLYHLEHWVLCEYLFSQPVTWGTRSYGIRHRRLCNWLSMFPDNVVISSSSV
jgi:hypothetical protein